MNLLTEMSGFGFGRYTVLFVGMDWYSRRAFSDAGKPGRVIYHTAEQITQENILNV